MRRKIIFSSWKMHINTLDEVKDLASGIKDLTKDMKEVEMCLFPTFPLIPHLSKILEGSQVNWGAQNMSFVDYGAYTGEVPAPTLAELGCKYVEIGHAERRDNFNETDKDVNKKVKLCFKYGMIPLVCIGEAEDEKNEGLGHVKIKTQVLWTLEGLNKEDMKKVIFAYEPIWAIGKAEGASAEYVEDIHGFIREVISKEYGQDVAKEIRIIYGGSVKFESARELMEKENIDGLFAGRFSLKAEQFAAIAKAVIK